MSHWIRDFWGKARPEPDAADQQHLWHPLVWHLLDVGAVAQALVQQRPQLHQRLAALLGVNGDELTGFLGFLAASHDVGKFARAFQAKVQLPGLPFDPGLGEANPHNRHDADGLALWCYWLQEQQVRDRIWLGLRCETLKALIVASVCHHGEPAQPSTKQLTHQFGPGLEAATTCRDALLDLLLPAPISAPALRERQALEASHLIAGLVMVADWIGSNQRWFPYTAPDEDVEGYLEHARARAKRAVAEAGFVAPIAATRRSLAELTGKPLAPTPLQTWASNVPLPDGPALFILEDVTGAGKTEAAHVLVHRLMAAGRASGAFWAMPTQATANAMYARQAGMLARLFAPDSPRPSLALAHGQARFHPGFRASVSNWGTDEPGIEGTPADLTASAACAAFLADDRRLALLADVGAGTIDQAVLAVLPARFSPVRLLGLAEKVIVIDEAHAHDTYVTEEMRRLLRFHRGLGGSAIILSATLTNAQKEALARCWQGTQPWDALPGWVPNDMRYPLATAIGPADMTATEIAAAPWSRRRTPVKRVESPDQALDGLAQTLAAGGCAAWVRNTVDDVLVAADLARQRGLEPVVFHARFAQCDRQTIEAQLMRRFGPSSTKAERAGRLVIATQVIEQSLDLDFDQLASDLAPVDLLLQRAGRMRRHRRDRPGGCGEAMLLLSPEPVAQPSADWVRGPLPGTAAVYRDHAVLWRTARDVLARGALTVPDDVRALVEAVHAGTEAPEALVPSSMAAEGANRAHSAQAGHQLLDFCAGYVPGNVWESDLKIATRNIETSVTIRLARRSADGRISPWAEPPSGEQWPAWQAWALSEVRLSGRLARIGLSTLPALEQELAPIRARWGRFERDLPVCVLEPDGPRWCGQMRTAQGGTLGFVYGQESGLRIRNEVDCGRTEEGTAHGAETTGQGAGHAL